MAKKTTGKVRLNIIFRSEPEGGFTVLVPSLPGCITYGKNLSDAREMAIDAIQAYVISLKKHREPIPSDEEMFIGSIELPRKSDKQSLVYA